VIVSLNSTRLRLHACSNDGKLENDQIANFDWMTIGKFYVQEEYFIFEYKRSTMKAIKSIKLQTLFAQFMYDCCECIVRELEVTKDKNKQQE
jgi:hypothetical protein